MNQTGFSLVSIMGLFSVVALMLVGATRHLNQKSRELQSVRKRQSLLMLQQYIRASIDCAETFSKASINPKSPGTKCLSRSSHSGQQTSDETYLQLYASNGKAMGDTIDSDGKTSIGDYWIRASCSQTESSLVIRAKPRMDNGAGWYDERTLLFGGASESIGEIALNGGMRLFGLCENEFLDSFSDTSSGEVISAGRWHTCAAINGIAKCWGRNQKGQLGNNSLSDSDTPVGVSGLTTNVTAVASGDEHSCAIQNGGVKCWGKNDRGQLGNNSTTNSSVPVSVSGLTTGVTHLIAQANHSCAIQTGSVFCWGDKERVGANPVTSDALVPQSVTGLSSGVSEIFSPGSIDCAVKSGAVSCWGKTNSLLGEPATFAPFTVTGLASDVGGNLKSGLSSSSEARFFIKDGGVKAWGKKQRIGNSLSSDCVLPQVCPARSLSSGVSVVTTGATTACAIQNGAALCWGEMQANPQISELPSVVAGLESDVVEISSGLHHVCAIHKNLAKCWGDNQYGQVGIDSDKAFISSPTVVRLLP